MRHDTNLLEWMRKRASRLALLTLIGVSPALTNCYGRFALTRAVYEFNGDVSENCLIQSAVMWLFIWIPVYGFAMLADVFVFNLLEFWTGEQLIAGTVTTEDGSTLTLAPTEDADIAMLTLTKNGETISTQQVIRVSDRKLEVRELDGKLAATLLRDDKGRIEVQDGLGLTVKVCEDVPARLAMAN